MLFLKLVRCESGSLLRWCTQICAESQKSGRITSGFQLAPTPTANRFRKRSPAAAVTTAATTGDHWRRRMAQARHAPGYTLNAPRPTPCANAPDLGASGHGQGQGIQIQIQIQSHRYRDRYRYRDTDTGSSRIQSACRVCAGVER